MQLDTRRGTGVQLSSGPEGYLELPLVYSLLRQSWLDGGGTTAIANGEVRVLILTNGH